MEVHRWKSHSSLFRVNLPAQFKVHLIQKNSIGIIYFFSNLAGGTCTRKNVCSYTNWKRDRIPVHFLVRDKSLAQMSSKIKAGRFSSSNCWTGGQVKFLMICGQVSVPARFCQSQKRATRDLRNVRRFLTWKFGVKNTCACLVLAPCNGVVKPLDGQHHWVVWPFDGQHHWVVKPLDGQYHWVVWPFDGQHHWVVWPFDGQHHWVVWHFNACLSKVEICVGCLNNGGGCHSLKQPRKKIRIWLLVLSDEKSSHFQGTGLQAYILWPKLISWKERHILLKIEKVATGTR